MNLYIRQGAHLSDAVDQLMVVEPEFPQLAELPEGAGQVGKLINEGSLSNMCLHQFLK